MTVRILPIYREDSMSGIGASSLYMLNTKYLKLRPHKDAQFTELDKTRAVNQDATVKTIIWAGNLTSSGQRFHGVFSNT